MEQKKLLWVVFSAAGFVLIVAILGIVFFWDRSDGDEVRDDGKLISGVTRDFDPVEWVKNGSDYPGIESGPGETEEGGSDEMVLVYGDGEDPDSESVESGSAAEGKVPSGSAGTEAATDVGSKSGDDELEIVVYSPGEKTASSVPKNATAVSRTEKASPPVVTKEYWIQAGSYTSMVRADEVKMKLSEKGIASLITTKTVDDTDYYRVRIGPYGSKDEAEKFLGWIKGLSGFESSYVSMVYVNKKLN